MKKTTTKKNASQVPASKASELKTAKKVNAATSVAPTKAKPPKKPILAQEPPATQPIAEMAPGDANQAPPVEATPATEPIAEMAPEDANQAPPVEATPISEPIAAEPIQAADSESPAEVAAARAKAKSRKAKAPKAEGVRAGSKTATVLDLMKRSTGVTLQELMSATGWQAHSVRGFVSGTLGKKMGLTVISAKGENGARNYSITA